MPSYRNYTLMVSIVFWGVLLGGIVYSHLVYFPVFLSSLPASSVVVNGPFGLNESVFWMTIHPMLILSLVITLAANWGHPGRRKLIAATLAVYIGVIVISAIYFIPELGEFARSPASGLSEAEWLARGNRWQYLSWLRGAVMFVMMVPLLIALSRGDLDDGQA